MNAKAIARIVVDVEDRLVPRLHLRPMERMLYYHLLRHSLLVGKRSIRVTYSRLSKGMKFHKCTIATGLRGLLRKGCVRVPDWNKQGVLIEVNSPAKVSTKCEVFDDGIDEVIPRTRSGSGRSDFRARSRVLRVVLRRKQNNLCFYCFRRLVKRTTQLDHVVPTFTGGDNNPENFVAACASCNQTKGRLTAEDFLWVMRRQKRLTQKQFGARMRELPKKSPQRKMKAA